MTEKAENGKEKEREKKGRAERDIPPTARRTPRTPKERARQTEKEGKLEQDTNNEEERLSDR